jgi:hypothetical protein
MGNNFPADWDDDFGSAGPATIPGTTMALVSGKMGYGYLVDMANMGKWSPSMDNVVQKVRLVWRSTTTACGAVESWVLDAPVAWAGPDGTHVYVWSTEDYLRDYLHDDNGKFTTGSSPCFCNPWLVTGTTGPIDLPSDPPCAVPHSEGSVAGPYLSGGGALAVSSYGKAPGTGVLWATYADPTSTANGSDDEHYRTPGIVAAFDATDVSKPIWTSQDDATRDGLGNWAKFSPPTIANGKAYVGTFSNELVVYGLLAGK